MTDITANGHHTTGGLAPPVTHPRGVKDPTGASRSKRYRDNRKAPVTAPGPHTDTREAEKPNGFKGRVTVARDATVTVGKASKSKSVTASVQPRWQVADVAAYTAAIGLAAV